METTLTNLSFGLLLVSLILYWVQTINLSVASTSNGSVMVQNPSTSSFVSGHAIGTLTMAAGNVCLLTLLLIRWQQSGHFPLSNLYESLIFLSWCCTALHLALGWLPGSSLTEAQKYWIGSITAPSALWTQAFAAFSLPGDMQQPAPLVPALQSNWLMMHVTVMLVSYAALMVGSLLSMAYLILTKFTVSKTASDFAKTLDQVSYRLLGIGFPFLTIGILSGAVWANEAWGSYWSWDPKETWALLTWLVFAIYLHTRLNKGWTGEKPAFIASFGFLTVWVCYLGVNLLGEGLHSYGFFSGS